MKLVTGATGLVGGAIVLELLERRPDEPVFCIVRGASRAAVQERLEASLRHAAALYQVELPHDALEKRCRAIQGDITAPGCALDLGQLPETAELWHCAASIESVAADRVEAPAHDIGGTAHVLALAEQLGVARYNHVSTAYVVGDRTGLIREEPVLAERAPNNDHQAAKGRAEEMVEASNLDVVRILRPSIVVGHSRTARCTSATGMYGLIDQILQFRQEIESTLGDYLAHRSVSLIGRPATRLNIVPVDVLAEAIVTISEADAPAGIYQLANLNPPTLGTYLSVLMSVLGMREPRFVDSGEQLSSIDAAFNRIAGFHRSYLLQDKEFDCANSCRFVDADLLTWEFDVSELTRYIVAHLDRVGHEHDVRLTAAELDGSGR